MRHRASVGSAEGRLVAIYHGLSYCEGLHKLEACSTPEACHRMFLNMLLRDVCLLLSAFLWQEALAVSLVNDSSLLSLPFNPPYRLQISLRKIESPLHFPTLDLQFCILEAIKDVSLRPFNSPFHSTQQFNYRFTFSDAVVRIAPHKTAFATFTISNALFQLYKCFVQLMPRGSEREIAGRYCFAYWLIKRGEGQERGTMLFQSIHDHVTIDEHPSDQESPQELEIYQPVSDEQQMAAANSTPRAWEPLDFSRWDNDMPEISVGTTANSGDSVSIRVGDFFGDIPLHPFFIALYQTIIDRASRVPRSDVEDTLFQCEKDACRSNPLRIDYHRRPAEGIPKMDYATVIQGIAKLPVLLRRSRGGRTQECSFVVFHDRMPVIDGWIRKGR